MTAQTLQGLPVTQPVVVPAALHNQSDTSTRLSDFSIALHSRHSDPQNDGSDVSGEIRCLGKLLKTTKTIPTNSNRTCRVYLMSDRPLTLRNLQQWLLQQEQQQHRNCSVVTAPHKQGSSFLTEHGPWSGRGFFQDLAVVSQARDGLIAKFSTTSSKLLLELMEYDRTMEDWERGENRTESLQQCNL
jgi:hypothetical protein